LKIVADLFTFPIVARPMHVLLVAYSLAPVGPDPVGGSEQVLAQIDRALVAAGHTATIIAQEGSVTAGRLVPIPAEPGPIDDGVRHRAHAAIRAAIAREAPRADVVHTHGLDFEAYWPPEGPPMLATLHLPLDWYSWTSLNPERPDTWLNPVSPSQVARAPWAPAHLLAPVQNGVDVRLFAPDRARDYLLFLGRMCPEKGVETAIDASELAGARLLLAGELYPYPDHQAWFAERVRPRLRPRARWLGPVTGAPKRRLLTGARAVLVPSTVAETGSLVSMEALASGAPVIGSALGAVPDVVADGRTGFIVTPGDATAFANAIGRVGEIDRAACRAAALRRFPVEHTTDAYIALYRRLIAASARPLVRSVAAR